MRLAVRWRLAALLALVFALIIAVGGTLFIEELTGGLTASVSASVRARSSYALATGQRGTALIAAMGRNGAPDGPGEFAQIVDATGRIVSASGPLSAHRLVDAGTLDVSRRTPQTIEFDVAGSDSRVIVSVAPIPDSRQFLVVGASLLTVDRAVDGVEALLLVGGPIGVLVAAIAGALIAAAALRPVERMRRQAAKTSADADDFALEVPATRDEIAALATTMNDMLARLHGALGRQRGFVAAASHELRTPLTTLIMEIDLALRGDRSPAELRGALAAARAEATRLSRLCEGLLTLAQSGAGAEIVQMTTQRIEPVLAASIRDIERMAEARGVDLDLVCDDAELRIDDLGLRRVMTNLLENALRFSPRGGFVTVRARPDAVGASYEISVTDDGPGFPADFIPRAVEAFSRPDLARDREHGGAGLGLSLVDALVVAHGGTLLLRNRVPHGAEVIVALPAGKASGVAAPVVGMAR